MSYPAPQRPNILITGTPGTGKSTLTELLVELSDNGLTGVNIGDLVKKDKLYSSKDEKFDAYVIDEDRVVDALEQRMVQGGVVVDHHGCDFFPERWFQLVVVLRTATEPLFDRLSARQYSQAKVQENMEAEIMQVVLAEARENYKADVIVELQSDSVEHMEANAEAILQRYGQLSS